MGEGRPLGEKPIGIARRNTRLAGAANVLSLDVPAALGEQEMQASRVHRVRRESHSSLLQ